MNNKSLKFTVEKITSEDIEPLCNLCGSTEAELLPEVEFINNKELKSVCLSIFCSSKECRNLSYHYFEIDGKMTGTTNIDEFSPLPKGVKITCNRCGNQNLEVKVRLEQSGFKYVYDLVVVELSCSCGNCAREQFLGKYF